MPRCLSRIGRSLEEASSRGVEIVYLTKEEEAIYSGERGEALQKAIKAIVKVGESLGADRLIDIKHAHVSGISYYNIGDAGLNFIRHLYRSSVRTAVFSTLNPTGMDLDNWMTMGIATEFADKQLEIVKMLTEMGFQSSFTCVPYLLRPPREGEHLAWSESSAVGMANTYYGAYTNREAGTLALFSGLIGKTYYGGLHIEENRRPTTKVMLKGLEKEFAADDGVASAVGYILGERIDNGIPLIPLKVRPTFEAVKAYTAAAGASGNIALSYIENVTPGFTAYVKEKLEKIEIDAIEVKGLIKEQELSLDEGDLFFVGCPHATAEEIINIYEALRGCKKLKAQIVISTSRSIYEHLRKTGLIEKLLSLGVTVIKDTCPIVSPAFHSRFKRVVTVSGKALFYLPRQQSQLTLLSTKAKLGDLLCREF